MIHVDMTQENSQKKILAVYDLYSYAPTFNIYEFLTSARIHADIVGADAIDLLIIRRNISKATVIQPQGKSEYDFRINDILLNSVPMFPVKNVSCMYDDGACKNLIDSYQNLFPPNFSLEINPEKKESDRLYLQSYLRDFYLSGPAIPSISPPTFAFKFVRNLIDKQKLITITLRNARHLIQKNSNLNVWAKISNYFRELGFTVMLIPDIEGLDESMEVDMNSLLAVANPSYRSAFYDAATLNLCVSNGAIAPLYFNSNARMLLAKVYTDGTNTSKESFTRLSGITDKTGPWTRVPWHQFIFNENENEAEIIDRGVMLMNQVAEIEGDISLDGNIHPLFLDPWGKLDGTVYTIFNDSSSVKKGHATSAEDLVLLLLRDVRFFGAAKALIVRSLAAALKGRHEESLRFAKQAILLDGRYIDPYLIIAHIFSSKKLNSQFSNKYLQSCDSLHPIFFHNIGNGWDLNITKSIHDALTSV